MNRKIVGVTCDVVEIGGHRYHQAGEKYLRPILAMGALPRLIPSFGPGTDPAELLQGLDGLLLTGAISNVEPERYGAGKTSRLPPFDPGRDSTTLPLIGAALERDLPMLAICRGMQELNVAMGGTLHPKVHEVAGRMDHRAPKSAPLDEQYGPRHAIHLAEGGLLAGLAGAKEAMVNSLHWQAIDRLGDGLAVEATAPDGTVEAVRIRASRRFGLGVQWHPEWDFPADSLSSALFDAFRGAIFVQA